MPVADDDSFVPFRYFIISRNKLTDLSLRKQTTSWNLSSSVEKMLRPVWRAVGAWLLRGWGRRTVTTGDVQLHLDSDDRIDRISDNSKYCSCDIYIQDSTNDDFFSENQFDSTEVFKFAICKHKSHTTFAVRVHRGVIWGYASGWIGFNPAFVETIILF